MTRGGYHVNEMRQKASRVYRNSVYNTDETGDKEKPGIQCAIEGIKMSNEF